jgi:hypothetical protein
MRGFGTTTRLYPLVRVRILILHRYSGRSFPFSTGNIVFPLLKVRDAWRQASHFFNEHVGRAGETLVPIPRQSSRGRSLLFELPTCNFAVGAVRVCIRQQNPAPLVPC